MFYPFSIPGLRNKPAEQKKDARLPGKEVGRKIKPKCTPNLSGILHIQSKLLHQRRPEGAANKSLGVSLNGCTIHAPIKRTTDESSFSNILPIDRRNYDVPSPPSSSHDINLPPILAPFRVFFSFPSIEFVNDRISFFKKIFFTAKLQSETEESGKRRFGDLSSICRNLSSRQKHVLGNEARY